MAVLGMRNKNMQYNRYYRKSSVILDLAMGHVNVSRLAGGYCPLRSARLLL